MPGYGEPRHDNRWHNTVCTSSVYIEVCVYRTAVWGTYIVAMADEFEISVLEYIHFIDIEETSIVACNCYS